MKTEEPQEPQDPPKKSPKPLRPKTLRTAFLCFGLAAWMLVLAFLSVPLYQWFCQVTGFGGVTQIATSGNGPILEETMEVRFDASLAEDMPWEFAPVDRKVEVRIGETITIFYEAYNPTDAPTAGQATFNVYPYSMGSYFSKIECFCFQKQVLEAGERVQMPVTFFIDADMMTDEDAQAVRAVTLSYTFHVSD